MTLAKEAGLSTNWVTNGYLTSDTLDYVGPVARLLPGGYQGLLGEDLSAHRRDRRLSGYPRGGHCGPGIDGECTWSWLPTSSRGSTTNSLSLPKPGAVDRSGGRGRHAVAHHAVFPRYQWAGYPSTAIETLEDIYRMARGEGLNYPYLGNVPGHPYENTVCPSCGELLIDRRTAGSVTVRLVGRRARRVGPRFRDVSSRRSNGGYRPLCALY